MPKTRTTTTTSPVMMIWIRHKFARRSFWVRVLIFAGVFACAEGAGLSAIVALAVVVTVALVSAFLAAHFEDSLPHTVRLWLTD